jgi:hypothetical protein
MQIKLKKPLKMAARAIDVCINSLDRAEPHRGGHVHGLRDKRNSRIIVEDRDGYFVGWLKHPDGRLRTCCRKTTAQGARTRAELEHLLLYGW